jgi:hypothetical protein
VPETAALRFLGNFPGGVASLALHLIQGSWFRLAAETGTLDRRGDRSSTRDITQSAPFGRLQIFPRNLASAFAHYLYDESKQQTITEE